MSSRFRRAGLAGPLREMTGMPNGLRPLGHVARQRHAIGHRHALDRHEGDYVHGAQAGVLAALGSQVDERQRRFMAG